VSGRITGGIGGKGWAMNNLKVATKWGMDSSHHQLLMKLGLFSQFDV
jgi:hypothetical protein